MTHRKWPRSGRPTRLAGPALAALLAAACWPAAANAGEVRSQAFGQTADGRPVTAYTLVNATGASATILDYGGTIAEIRVPDRQGALGNVVLAFADLAGWEAVGHANANIGRYANRIRGGFTLDGVHYPLQQNAAGITLHGGPPPYSTRIWTAAPLAGGSGPASVTLLLDSPAGDQGFPGTVRIAATYTFTDDNALRLDFEATTDRPTVINLTNHIYFNLSGNSTASVYGHRLTLAADRIAVKDAQGMPSGELKSVAGSPLDARKSVPVIQLVASAADPAYSAPRPVNSPAAGQLRSLDHSYAFPEGFGGLEAVAARLEDDASGRVLELRTTEPSVQVFVPGGRTGTSDANGPFRVGPAIALETQHLPDSPNQPHFPSTVLRPGQVFRSTTTWDFGTFERH